MSAKDWIREHAVLSGALSGLVVAGVTGVAGYSAVEVLGVWSQHQAGNSHVAVTERLDEISKKLDAKPDQEDLENLVRATVADELRNYVTPTLAALQNRWGNTTFEEAVAAIQEEAEGLEKPR